jgi:Methyltransferase domain
VTMFKTDKVSRGFLPVYLEIAAQIGTSGYVCELGVDVGGSLEMWQYLFPHGRVVGVDHSEGAGWPEGTVRIVMDQSDPRLPTVLATERPRSLEGYRDRPFDLIVDDASHQGVETETALKNLWPLVRRGGWYVIEDWGVGFPAWTPSGDSMLVLAKDLLHCFEPGEEFLIGVESITYRDGLIIIKKKES